MNDKLPVLIENNSMPIDSFNMNNRKDSYGYVSILYLISVIITAISIMICIFLGNR